MRLRLVMGVVLGGLLIVLLLLGPALAAGFSDVSEPSDYPDAVDALSDLGVINGYSEDNTFRPHNPVIRQQFAKMIVKLLSLEVTGQEICPFVDVASGQDESDPNYPDKYVAVCASAGITQGKTPTTFAPYANITRAQVLTMVVRAALSVGMPLDDPSPEYYAGTSQGTHAYNTLSDPDHGLNVQTAEFNGLLAGVRPDDPSTGGWGVYQNASRGEVAQILWRLWQKLLPPPTTTTTEPPTTTTTEPPTTTTTTTGDSTTTTTTLLRKAAKIGELARFTYTLTNVQGSPMVGVSAEWYMEGVGFFLPDDGQDVSDPDVPANNRDFDVTDVNGIVMVRLKSNVAGEQTVFIKIRIGDSLLVFPVGVVDWS